MNKIKISICIPIYGVEKYIKRCAESVFNQTYANIEYVFVNDCTKDQSIAILKQVIENTKRNKEHIHIINHETNKGLAGARNTAVQFATGDYIMHIDSDDYIDNQLVEKLVNKLLKNNYDLILFDQAIIKSNKIKIRKASEIIDKDMLTISILRRESSENLCGKLIKKSLYTDNNIKAIEGLNQSEDYLVTPQLAYFSKNISFLHGYYYYYCTDNTNSLCNSYNGNNIEQVWKVISILKVFFADKGEIFIEAINHREAISYSLHRCMACMNNDIKIYKEATQKFFSLKNKYRKNIPIKYKISMHLTSFKCLKLYLRSFDFIKNYLIK